MGNARFEAGDAFLFRGAHIVLVFLVVDSAVVVLLVRYTFRFLAPLVAK